MSHHVDGGERHVEGEVKCLFVACLAVREPGQSLSRAVEELDLEPCPVEVEDIPCAERPVSEKVNLTGLLLLVGVEIVHDDHLADAVKAVHSDFAGMHHDGFPVVSFGHLAGEHFGRKPVKVHASRELAGAALALMLWTGVEIAHPGVVMKPADELEAHGPEPFHKRAVGKIRVRDNQAGNLQEAFGIHVQGFQITSGQAVGLLEILEESRPASLSVPALEGLDRLEMDGLLRVGVDHGDAEDLKPPLGHLRAAGPEVAQAGRLLAGLVDVAGVYRYGDALGKHSGGKLGVVADPVEGPPVVLPIPAFTGVSGPRHGCVVDASAHDDVKNHGPDEEIAKTFA